MHYIQPESELGVGILADRMLLDEVFLKVDVFITVFDTASTA